MKLDGYRGLDCKVSKTLEVDKIEMRKEEPEPEPEDPSEREPTLMDQMAEACKFESVSDEEIEEEEGKKLNDKVTAKPIVER